MYTFFTINVCTLYMCTFSSLSLSLSLSLMFILFCLLFHWLLLVPIVCLAREEEEEFWLVLVCLEESVSPTGSTRLQEIQKGSNKEINNIKIT